MDKEMMNDISAAGWTCAICGTFVPSGHSHTCPPPPVGRIDLSPTYVTKMDEDLRRKLDRIIELLEELAGYRR
jgi:hypothetical protein